MAVAGSFLEVVSDAESQRKGESVCVCSSQKVFICGKSFLEGAILGSAHDVLSNRGTPGHSFSIWSLLAC